MNPRKQFPCVPDLSDQELAGFLQLLVAGRELPEFTPEIAAYIRRLEDGIPDAPSGMNELYPSKARRVCELLRAAQPRPVRPFGTHILAKRSEARCDVEEVARILGEHVDKVRAIENRTVNPFSLGVERLTRIVVLFGLYLTEFRQALSLEALDMESRGYDGPSFARSKSSAFRATEITLAVEDLLRPDKGSTARLDPVLQEQIDSTVFAVKGILEKKGCKELVDC